MTLPALPLEGATAWYGHYSAVDAAVRAIPASTVKTPEQYGAVGNGTTNDQAALAATLTALKSGDTLLLAGTYAHSGTLTLATDRVQVRGGGEVRATAQATSSFTITGNRVTVEDVTFSLSTPHTGRGNNLNHHKVILNGCIGAVLRRVTVKDSYAAGIFCYGATNFLIDSPVVSDTAADGVHCTNGSSRGEINFPTTRNTGDDGVAVVSYTIDAATCSDIVVRGATVIGTVTGRGVTCVGGTNVRFSDFLVEAPSGAGVLVGTEAVDPGVVPESRSVTNVVFERGTIIGANKDAPSPDYGAVLVAARAPNSSISGVTIRDVTVRDTKTTASRVLGILTANGSVSSGILLQDIRIEGTAPAATLVTTGTPAASYRAVGIRRGVAPVAPEMLVGYAAAAAGNVETVPRISLAEISAGSGGLWITYFTSPVDVTVSTLGMPVGGTVRASATMTRLGLFTVAANDSLTLVARTGNATTLGAAAYANVDVPLATAGGYPATYTLLAGVRYALGFLQVATTTVAIRFVGITNGAMPPVIARKVNGQTDIAASYAVASIPVHDGAIYLYGKP